MVVGVLVGACVRGTAPGPTVEPEPASRVETPAEVEAEVVTTPRVDYDEGFSPPPGLVRPPDPLAVDESMLAEAKGAPASLRVEPVAPWSESASLDAPKLAEPTDDPPCRREHYLAHDARPLRTVALEHDARGRLTRERIDEDTDGTIDLDRRYGWGADGRLESLRERHGPQPACHGVDPAWVLHTEHRYDRFGTWLGALTREDGEIGDYPEWRHTAYDLDGRPLLWVRHQYGAVIAAETRRWDEQGRLLSKALFEGEEPVAVERWAYAGERERYHAVWMDGRWMVRRLVFDDQGRAVEIQRDDDGDGHVDAHTTIEHDEQGREIWRRTDGDRDGERETTVQTEWDAAGRKSAEVLIGPEGTSRRTWSYDDAGRLLRWSNKHDEHWAEDFESHRYDEQGREVERRSERYQQVTSASDLSGYVDREHWRGEYDDKGRLRTATVLEGELGPNERIEYVYDCRRPYRRHPRRNPLDHPETAAECFEVFE